MSDNPAVEVAKERLQEQEEVHTLSTGIKVRLKPVSPSLLAEVTARVQPPPVPIFYDEKKKREIENPSHPAYLDALERTNAKRGIVAMDAMALFGVELVDGLPENNGWIKRLRMLGVEFDESDPIECEFYYIKHIALHGDDWKIVSSLSGVTQEDIRKAEATFRAE